MERKKAPHKLQVEDSKQDDNSIVEMTQAKMDELKIFKGDAVILKGKPLKQNPNLLPPKSATKFFLIRPKKHTLVSFVKYITSDRGSF